MMDERSINMCFCYMDEADYIERYCNEHEMQYKVEGDCFLVQTETSYWKIYYFEDRKAFTLHHGNGRPPEKEIKRYPRSYYHFQGDTRDAASIMEYLIYIHKHDEFRAVVPTDYHKLPRDTREQKKRYEAAKKRSKRNSRRKMYRLFDQLEANNPGYKALSLG